MYFVRYHSLKEKLSGRSLSDREALPYLVLYSTLFVLFIAIPTIEGFNEFDMVLMCLNVMFAIVGICYVYQQNGGKEGFDLIQKYVVLGWVVEFRLLLLYVPVFLFLVVVGERTLWGGYSDGLTVLISVIYQLIFYQRLGRHIRDTKNIATDQVA